ncbi:hypothetical protein EJ04DRAFT_436405 [Polyplosphaeria fusca]|uniref:DUF6594 domain-containing protein n=1 Tax=Polyplosphaeria fusca TaxID=682080 RepID=A0A9P4QW49_9PLEO|nr:hypothetical protein EJ04DRAFT_436405 [Polyplosphaeria fusca]
MPVEDPLKDLVAGYPLKDLVPGYPKLAGKMEVQPEVTIFRRFGALNARNLLYIQAELTMLEEDLVQYESGDNNSQRGDKRNYATDWYWLRESHNDGDTVQLDTVLKIRQLLKEYSTLFFKDHALIQQKLILSCEEPDNWDLSDIQNFLAAPRMRADERFPLFGGDSVVWGSANKRKPHAPDLIALKPRVKKDPFSEWTARHALSILLRCGCVGWVRPSSIVGLVGYQDKTVLRITYWVTNLFASLMPIASIVVLHLVRPMSARLSIIAAFNVALCIGLSGLTSAKRSEIFAVTAA